MQSKTVTFKNKVNNTLTGSIEFPSHGSPVAYVLMAHCFACTRKTKAGTFIARAMVNEGFAVLRFDFSGLGQSAGEFGDTNFSTNVDDLVAAADFLRENYSAPEILVGHSLGGTAVIEASKRIPECMAVSTIGSPADPEHVTHLIEDQMHCIIETGQANIELAGRELTIKKQFIDDLKAQEIEKTLHNLNKAILIFHSPWDDIVSIKHAELLYTKALHPKSFVSLDTANHMLTKRKDAEYVGTVLAAWATKYLKEDAESRPAPKVRPAPGEVNAKIGKENYVTQIDTHSHAWLADEPITSGGKNLGPDPFEMLAAALGTCTSMTLRMYADRKKWPLDEITTTVQQQRLPFDKKSTQPAHLRPSHKFTRTISIKGNLDDSQKNRLVEIANRCPVHRSLEGRVETHTVIDQ